MHEGRGDRHMFFLTFLHHQQSLLDILRIDSGSGAGFLDILEFSRQVVLRFVVIDHDQHWHSSVFERFDDPVHRGALVIQEHCALVLL